MTLDPAVPRLPGPDHTIPLLREGYQFVGRRCDARGVDGFVARIRGRQTLCIRGMAGAELAYGDPQVTRSGAIPAAVRHLLQDDGSVQGLDGDAHQRRRDVFLDVLGPTGVARVVELVRARWGRAVQDWPAGATRPLGDVVDEVLAGAALEWTGMPHDRATVSRLAAELASMVDHAGLPDGLSVDSLAGNWRARARRRGTERWVEEHLRALRDRQASDDGSSPAARVASHREGGEPLEVSTAAVELINLLRPVVAIRQFVVFTAMALARHPQWQEPLADGDRDVAVAFAHEVRRSHPFFPAILVIAEHGARWGEIPVPPGTGVLFDLYGTNHHPELWPYPWAFRPDRHRDADVVARLVPQGWGDPISSHRCPGEPMTVQVVAAMAGELARFPHLLPMQDLTLPLNHLPTRPSAGLQVTRTA